MIRFLFDKLGVHNKEEFVALLKQFIKFGIVGLSNTAVSLGVYYLVLWIDPDLYLLGSILGAIISIANSFFWNNKFVFKTGENDARSVLKRLLKTYVSYGGTTLLANLLLWIEVDLLGVSKTIAPIINLIITIPLNFIINKLWTFKKTKDTGPETSGDNTEQGENH